MNDVTAFIRLSRRDRELLLRAMGTLCVCWIRIRIQGVEKLEHWALQRGEGGVSVEELNKAVDIAAKRFPRSTCLQRALALQRMLALNGHPSQLRIGVQRSGEQFLAHAWLVKEGRTLIGDSELEKYHVLFSWGSAKEEEERTRRRKA